MHKTLGILSVSDTWYKQVLQNASKKGTIGSAYYLVLHVAQEYELLLNKEGTFSSNITSYDRAVPGKTLRKAELK